MPSVTLCANSPVYIAQRSHNDDPVCLPVIIPDPSRKEGRSRGFPSSHGGSVHRADDTRHDEFMRSTCLDSSPSPSSSFSLLALFPSRRAAVIIWLKCTMQCLLAGMPPIRFNAPVGSVDSSFSHLPAPSRSVGLRLSSLLSTRGGGQVRGKK